MKNLKKHPDQFREELFRLYGFTAQARKFIRSHSAISVRDFGSVAGGGFWHPDKRLVELLTAQHEGGVHELAHVWWHWFRIRNPSAKTALARDVITLADIDPSSSHGTAIQFARGYAYGAGDWIGMYANADYKNNPKNLPKDIHNLTKKDMEQVNDWEIFAGLASFTMGKFKDGPRALPEFMWTYFTPLFTGETIAVPYYTGGHP